MYIRQIWNSQSLLRNRGKLVLVSVLLLAGLSYWIVAKANRISSVSVELSKQLTLGVGTIIDFSHLASFDWDYLYVFPPYSDSRIIEKELGFLWAEVEEPTIQDLDSVNLIVFTKESRVVHWFELERARCDFWNLKGPQKYTKGEAKFRIRQNDSRIVMEALLPKIEIPKAVPGPVDDIK